MKERLQAAIFLLSLLPAAQAWARGGEGCFLPDTGILAEDSRSIPIHSIKPGDRLLSFTLDDQVVPTRVREVYSLEEDGYLEITAGHITVRTTVEHPFYVGGGTFQTAQRLRPGDTIRFFDGKGLASETIRLIRNMEGPVRVFNIRTDAPNTFFADRFAVHNKGDDDSGSSYASSGDSGSSDTSSDFGSDSQASSRAGTGSVAFVLIIFFLCVFGFFGIFIYAAKQSSGKNLDYLYARKDIAGKSSKTLKLLAFLSKTDAMMKPESLVSEAMTVFRKLQECWQTRTYAPMAPLLMPSLYRTHLAQLAAQVRRHEINKIEQLIVNWADIVHIRYTHEKGAREFTALFQACARDYYADDRTDKFRRGDKQPATFQEFWTFQWSGDRWLLRQIDQTRESDILREENFVEAFTPDQMAQIYGETPGETVGPLGTWRPQVLETKETRTHRMLNFLAKTDALWNEDGMKETARQSFMAVHMARERNSSFDVKEILYPDVLKALAGEMQSRQANQARIEFRQLCIRKVDIVLVRNFTDNLKDEFTARIAAHAQKTVLKGDTVSYQQPHVAPFEEYWTFGRLENQWKLKEILPPAQGSATIMAENVDQDAIPEQLQWYYTKERAL